MRSGRIARLGRNAALGLLLFATPLRVRAHGALHDRIRELSAALAEAPHDAALHFALADVYSRHGEWEPALAQLTEVERLAPGRFPTDLVRGQSLLDAGRAAEALAELDRFLAAQPGHAHALLLRARANGALDRAEASLDDYRHAVTATGGWNPELVVEATEALVMHGRSIEALEILHNALAALGAHPQLARLALELELGAGRYDEALILVAVLESSGPRREPWMARRAEILTRAGRREEARAAWQALSDHIAALPNLDRGQPALRLLAAQADAALAT